MWYASLAHLFYILPASPQSFPPAPKGTTWLLFCNLCLKKHETSQKMAGSGLNGVSFSFSTFTGWYIKLENVWNCASSSTTQPHQPPCFSFFCRQQTSWRLDKSKWLNVIELFLLLFVKVKILCSLICIWSLRDGENKTVSLQKSYISFLHVNEIHLWPPFTMMCWSWSRGVWLIKCISGLL